MTLIHKLPELLILRHGETEWNRAGRLQGALDSPLTGRGEAQARQQGAILRAMGAEHWDWVASPQGRAVETARIAGRIARTDTRLREIGMGDWTGAMRAELMTAHPALFHGAHLAWYDCAPGGETIAGVAVRVAEFLQELTDPTVIVTHGITSRVIRCLATGHPVSEFGRIEGGQGIVFHLSGGASCRLTSADSARRKYNA